MLLQHVHSDPLSMIDDAKVHRCVTHSKVVNPEFAERGRQSRAPEMHFTLDAVNFQAQTGL